MLDSFEGNALYMLQRHESIEETAGRIYERDEHGYIVLVLGSAEELLTAATPSVRPSGILIEPPEDDRIGKIIDEVYEDYKRSHKVSLSDECIFRIRGVEYKTAYKDIILIEVQNKKIKLRTRSQIFEFSDSLESVMRLTPDCFVRIHKSYVVNTNYVRLVNYKEKTLLLTDDSVVYFSRRYGAELKEYFKNTLKENCF
jgi:DNA-binding LytR/AlgR family response regulator